MRRCQSLRKPTCCLLQTVAVQPPFLLKVGVNYFKVTKEGEGGRERRGEVKKGRGKERENAIND